MNRISILFSWRKTKKLASLPLLMVAFLQHPVSANPPDGQILLGPGNPNGWWAVDRALFPGESVTFEVGVADGGFANGKSFVLDGTPQVRSLGPNTLWSKRLGSDFVFEALNSGNAPISDTIEVLAKWKEQMNNPVGGGGGSPPEPETIGGVGSGFATTDRPVFTWQFDPNTRMQFADTNYPIEFTLTAAASGATINLADYNIANDHGWTIATDPATGATLTGTVKSDSPGKGELKVMYNGKEQGRSPEIAFAKLDLQIASFGNGAFLVEDRVPENAPLPATPHEMDPGSVVIAPSQDGIQPGSRSKLVLTGNGGNSDDGTYKLDQQNLAKVEIYDSPTDGTLVNLPKEWTAGEFGASQTLYVGSESFTAEEAPQDGTLILTYERTLEDDQAKPKLEDKARVHLLPIDVTVRKKSEVDAPPTGLLVKKGTEITFDINGTAPANAFSLPENTVKWKIAQLKHDGTLTAWTPVPGEGPELDFTTNTSGIFQAKAVITVAGGQAEEFLLIRKIDAPHADDSTGTVQDFHKKGAEDYFGVVEADWQIAVRDKARMSMGSTFYSQAGSTVVQGSTTAGPGTDKCNIFVYHKCNDAGATVPLTRGGGPIPFYYTSPPLAIDWWNDNTGRTDNASRTINSIAISGWQRLPDATMPEPGLVPSRPNLGGNPDQYGSHVGIFDYDGSWISAGPLKINKYYHPKTSGYQPQGYRRFN